MVKQEVTISFINHAIPHLHLASVIYHNWGTDLNVTPHVVVEFIFMNNYSPFYDKQLLYY